MRPNDLISLCDGKRYQITLTNSCSNIDMFTLYEIGKLHYFK